MTPKVEMGNTFFMYIEYWIIRHGSRQIKQNRWGATKTDRKREGVDEGRREKRKEESDLQKLQNTEISLYWV